MPVSRKFKRIRGGKKSRRRLRKISRKVGGKMRGKISRKVGGRSHRKTSRNGGGRGRRNLRKTSRNGGGRARRNLRKTSRKYVQVAGSPGQAVAEAAAAAAAAAASARKARKAVADLATEAVGLATKVRKAVPDAATAAEKVEHETVAADEAAGRAKKAARRLTDLLWRATAEAKVGEEEAAKANVEKEGEKEGEGEGEAAKPNVEGGEGGQAVTINDLPAPSADSAHEPRRGNVRMTEEAAAALVSATEARVEARKALKEASPGKNKQARAPPPTGRRRVFDAEEADEWLADLRLARNWREGL